MIAIYIFFAVCFFLSWILFKIFPCLKKLNWKVLAALFVTFKIFDIHSTYLCFGKTHDYEAETNVIFHLFYKNFGFPPLWALIVPSIIIVPLIIFLMKVLMLSKSKPFHFIAFGITLGALLACINNYLIYFSF